MKRRITIAFLGIDGTGKSTHAENINSWLLEHEIKSIIIPFHKWMFVDILKRHFGKYVDKGRNENSLSPYTPKKYSLPALIKPPVALLDNFLMFYYNKWKFKDYDVIIFDRFVCATFIKSKALNYHVDWLRPIWKSIKTDIVILLDAPTEKSLHTIDDRGNHILYNHEQLLCEKKEYLEIAKEYNYRIFNTSKSFKIVNKEIKDYLKQTLAII